MHEIYWYILGLQLIALAFIEIFFIVAYFPYKCQDILIFIIFAFVIDLSLGYIIILYNTISENHSKSLIYCYNIAIWSEFILGIWALLIYFTKYNCQYSTPNLWPFLLIHFAIFWCYICRIILSNIHYRIQYYNNSRRLHTVAENDTEIINNANI
jgi:hypothetical protein